MTARKTTSGSVLAYAASTAEATSAFLLSDEAAAPADLSVDPAWRFHLPLRADAGVAFLGEVGKHVPGLSFTAQDLLSEKQRLLQVQSAREAIEIQLARLIIAETLHKNRLTEWVGQLDQAITARRIDPTVDAKIKEDVALAAAPFVSVGEHYQEAQTSLRRTTIELKQQLSEAQSTGAHKDLVIRALQGERVSPTELQTSAAPRTKARKPRR
jgi:hypothetical protein